MGVLDILNPFESIPNLVGSLANSSLGLVGLDSDSKGGKGPGGINVPNPADIAATDFLFNRVDQFGPTGSTEFFAPGESFTRPQTPGFLNEFATQGSPFVQQPQSQIGGGKQPVQDSTDIPSRAFGAGTEGIQDIFSNFGARAVPGVIGNFGANAGRAPRAGQEGVGTVPSGTTDGTAAPSGNIFDLLQNTSNAAQVTNLTPEQLLLSSGRLTAEGNTLFDVLNRQGGGLPGLTSDLDLSGLPSQLGLSGATGGLRGLAGTTPSGVDIGGLQTDLPGNFGDVRRDVTDAFFESGSELLNRNFERDIGRIEDRIANRGFSLDVANQGASGALTPFVQSRQDALNQLARDAILFGGGEARADVLSQLGIRGQEVGELAQNVAFGQQATGIEAGLQGQVFNQLLGQRGAGFQEQLTQEQLTRNERDTLFNELQALQGGGLSSLGQGTPAGPGGINIADAFGLQQSAQTSNANLAQANKGSNIQGGTGLATAAALLFGSSRELKDRMSKESDILNRLDNVDIERWHYKDSDVPHIGPYAEDFNAAFNLPDNPYIFYTDMFGVLMGAVKELRSELQSVKQELKEARNGNAA